MQTTNSRFLSHAARTGAGACLILLLAGCTQDLSRFESRRNSRAPASEKDLGVLVRGASELQMVHLLENSPHARFRNLTPQAGFYEIYGVDVKGVRREMPKAHVTKNRLIPLNPNRDAMARARVYRALQTVQDFSAPTQCAAGEDEPLAEVRSLAPNGDVEFSALPRGSHVTLTSDRSESPLNANEKLRRAWVIINPESAAEKEVVQLGTTLDFDANDLGTYGVALVVQDKRDVCGTRFFQFSTTENKKYLGRSPSSDKIAKTFDLSPFEHLKTLRAEDAWKTSQGEGMTIAVIDTGVNYNHALLRNQIALNSKEIPENLIDDDGNGLVDDVLGWDYVMDDAFPFDDVGHGSHVTGLAVGFEIGLAQKAKYIPIKAMGGFGGDAGTVSAAIRYALARKAQIINMSIGKDGDLDDEVAAAVSEAEKAGALIVAAAGNGDPITNLGVNTDTNPNYPSAFPNSNILAVASATPEGDLESYSNFGPKSVDVATLGGKQGKGLKSAYLDNSQQLEFINYSGTSMATPVAAGIAALVWSIHPSQSYAWVKSILIKAGTETTGLKGNIQSGRLLDAFSAISLAGESTLASAP